MKQQLGKVISNERFLSQAYLLSLLMGNQTKWIRQSKYICMNYSPLLSVCS